MQREGYNSKQLSRQSTADRTLGAYPGEAPTSSKRKRNKESYDDKSPSSRASAARFCGNLRAASVAAAKNKSGASMPGSGSKRKRRDFMIYNNYSDVDDDADVYESLTKSPRPSPRSPAAVRPRICLVAFRPQALGTRPSSVALPSELFRALHDLLMCLCRLDGGGLTTDQLFFVFFHDTAPANRRRFSFFQACIGWPASLQFSSLSFISPAVENARLFLSSVRLERSIVCQLFLALLLGSPWPDILIVPCSSTHVEQLRSFILSS